MTDDVTANAVGEASVEDLQAVIAAQQAELSELRARIAGPATSRRTLLKGAGVVAGGLAAIGAVQATTGGLGKPEVAGAIEGHNVKYGNGMSVFATITASKQGVIKGDTVQKGREGQIECNYFQNKVVVPRDAATGQTTGRRQYDAIVIRKDIDKATPLLTLAMINNELLSSVRLDFYEVSPTLGTEVLFFRIDLVNASLASYNWWSPDSLQSGVSGGGGAPKEELELVFQRITWTHVPTGASAQDDFSDPSA